MEISIEELRTLLRDSTMEGYKKAMNNMGNTKPWSTNIENNSDLFNGDNEPDNPCLNCPNNLRNGGSGICHCILGQRITYSVGNTVCGTQDTFGDKNMNFLKTLEI